MEEKYRKSRFTVGVRLQSRLSSTGGVNSTGVQNGGAPLLIVLRPKIQSIMAEFVSAIVGLPAAGAKVSGSIYTLIDTLKDAPNEFLALSNEVTDFQLILPRVIEVRESGELSLEDERPSGGFDILIERGKKYFKMSRILCKR